MRFPILFACAAALLLISVGASHAAAPAITGEMQKKYESMQSFTAEFTQRLVHQESGSEETRQGTLAFQKPLRVRWETKAPHAELLVITDKDVWDYLPDEELAFMADNAEFFSLTLPGRDEPLGDPGGALKVGRVGVDTPLVASLPASEKRHP